jgi:hypothetical protein
MSFWDSFGDGLLGGGGSSSDFWSGFGDGGVLDSGGGGSWTDYLGGDWGDGGGSFFDFNGSGGDSSGGGIMSTISKIFGGGGSSSGGGSIWTSLLGGLAGAADAKISGQDLKDSIKLQGTEQRKTADFEAALKDYYTQQDKVRKRQALDTYGQFSLMDRINPGYKDTPPVQMPPKPTVG